MSNDQYQYLPVNWMDGMKINKSHFIDQNNAFTCQVAQSASGFLNIYNYGLLPGAYGDNNTRIFVSADNQQHVQVRLQKCQAITLGGHIIRIDENDGSANNFKVNIPDLNIPFSELKGKSVEYFVVIVVNPYKRVPHGEAGPNEMPPRLPYTLPFYELQLMPVSETRQNVLGNFHLPLAKLKIDEQRVLIDEDYIAPCCYVSSHNDLVDIHASLEVFFGKMELYALQIIQKILQKKQQNEMALIVQRLCEQIAFFTALHIGEFKQLNLFRPPVFLINLVCSFARLLKNTLDFYIGSGKEELVNYCIEWCDIRQGELEMSVADLSNHQYNHLDINESIKKVSVFTKHISHLFFNLSKLEYIGRRRETGIFVTEQTVASQPETPSRTRRSFLAD